MQNGWKHFSDPSWLLLINSLCHFYFGYCEHSCYSVPWCNITKIQGIKPAQEVACTKKNANLRLARWRIEKDERYFGGTLKSGGWMVS